MQFVICLFHFLKYFNLHCPLWEIQVILTQVKTAAAKAALPIPITSVCALFLGVQTMVWLPALGTFFYACTAVKLKAWECTWRLYRHGSLHCKFTPGEKTTLLQQGLETCSSKSNCILAFLSNSTNWATPAPVLASHKECDQLRLRLGRVLYKGSQNQTSE